MDNGSSPLARGLRVSSGSLFGSGGIIPARAGFTGDVADGDDFAQDHPRSRGVYRGAGSGAGVRAGSSPLARGLRITVSRGTSKSGIIPARAGFTASRG